MPIALHISNIVYVGSSPADEYLELTNPTDQMIAVPIQTWKIRIGVAAGQADWPLGLFFSAPFNIPAHQSCRIYTSKQAASADEVSPCGFLSMDRPEDVDGIYPNLPGVRVTLLNGESRVVSFYQY